jgi:hypothetical protein
MPNTEEIMFFEYRSIAKSSLRKYALPALLFTLTAGLPGPAAAAPSGKEGLETPSFEFALTGDAPYTAAQRDKVTAMIQEMNREKLAFVVHDGDFKSGSTLCNDATFHDRLQIFQSSTHPFVYVPGDNEWTDCHRANNGGYDPLERLAKLREMFFSGDLSLGGRTLKLARQSDEPGYPLYRENLRWTYGDVVFVGLNVPGSNNNFGRTPAMDAEYRDRNAANLAWMKQAFDLARQKNARGIMLIIQADPGFELAPTDGNRTGYNDFLAALQSETLAFGKPVVLVHGDSHYFRIDKPMVDASSQIRVDNFTRVETFGNPDVQWLRVKVDFRNPNVFVFEQGRPTETGQSGR